MNDPCFAQESVARSGESAASLGPNESGRAVPPGSDSQKNGQNGGIGQNFGRVDFSDHQEMDHAKNRREVSKLVQAVPA